MNVKKFVLAILLMAAGAAQATVKFAFAACAILTLPFFSGCSPEKEVVLVEKGEAKAYVALDADACASVTNAATALVHWVREKTGAELSVLRAPSPAATMAIDPGKRRLVASVGNANGSAKENLSDNSGDSLRSDETSLPREEAPSGTPITFRKLSAADPAAGFKYDGFRVDATARRVTISAIEDQGFEFAVHYLLNRYAGIDWFHPDSGADFETSDTLAVPAGTLAKTPPREREGALCGNPKQDRAAKQERVRAWNVRNGFPTGSYRMGGHIIGEWLLWTPVDEAELKREKENVLANWSEAFRAKPRRDVAELYARWKILVRQHPDWFALVDGKRVACGQDLMCCKGRTAMPCLSNPEVREQMLKNYLERRHSLWFAKWPRVSFALICDDHPCWCECENCLKLIKYRGRSAKDDMASDYYWDFVNWIVPRMLAADPTLTVDAYAYQSHRAFPQKVKPLPQGDRLKLVMCTHGRCYLHSLTNSAVCAGNTNMTARLLEWTRAGFPVSTFEYHGQTPGRCNYYFWERAWIDDVKWYRANNIMHGHGYLLGPWHGWFDREKYYFDRNNAKSKWFTLYLTGHFYWDPDDDFDTVRDKMLTKYYRAAGKEMLAYHKYLEKKVYDLGQHMFYVDTEEGFHDHFAQCVAGRPGVLKPAQDLLAAAKRAAADDPKALERIAWDEKYFKEEWELAAPIIPTKNYFGHNRRYGDELHGENYCYLGGLGAYPAIIKRFHVTFKAKGKAHTEFTFQRRSQKGRYVKAAEWEIDSPDDFKEYAFDVDCGPDRLGPFIINMRRSWVEFKDFDFRGVVE